MEVSSHSLDQQRVAGCRFVGAVFTNLTQDHLDYHPSMEEYFGAKARLFSDPFLAGDAVVNVDDPWGQRLASELLERGVRCWRASLERTDVELRVEDLVMGADGIQGTLVTPQGRGPFHSPLVGRFNLMNLLEAVGVLQQQGIPLAQLLEAQATFRGVPGRMERVSFDGGTVGPAVLVDYAHTPDGLENALAACRPFSSGRLICVFGCGGDRDRSKRPLMGAIAARLADAVVVTTDNPRTEDPEGILADVVSGIPSGTNLEVEIDRARAIASAIAAAGPADLVLIAVPVAATQATLEALLPHLGRQALVMDVGSTKHDVARAAQAARGDRIGQFMPAHPICGKEVAGIEHADAALYQDRQVILTPLPCHAPADVERARAIWLALPATKVSNVRVRLSLWTVAAGVAGVSRLALPRPAVLAVDVP
jgi:UDP-N-acetylmuramyl tripeptide synthase